MTFLQQVVYSFQILHIIGSNVLQIIAAAAFTIFLLQSRPLVNQLLKPETPGGFTPNSQESSSLLSPAVLATLSIQLNEEVTVDSLSGLKHREWSAPKLTWKATSPLWRKVKTLVNEKLEGLLHCLYSTRFAKLPPLASTRTSPVRIRVVNAARFRRKIPIYDKAGSCPTCGEDSDSLAIMAWSVGLEGSALRGIMP